MNIPRVNQHKQHDDERTGWILSMIGGQRLGANQAKRGWSCMVARIVVGWEGFQGIFRRGNGWTGGWQELSFLFPSHHITYYLPFPARYKNIQIRTLPFWSYPCCQNLLSRRRRKAIFLELLRFHLPTLQGACAGKITVRWVLLLLHTTSPHHIYRLHGIGTETLLPPPTVLPSLN